MSDGAQPRDSRVEPRPGDELFSATLKCKVVSVTYKESGISDVEYMVAGAGYEYHPEYTAHATLTRWMYFAAPAGSEKKVEVKS